jgi:hypothetical protein
MAALHLQIHDRGAVSLSIDVGDGQTALGCTLFAGRTPAAEQILDGAIAMQFLLLRDLCGTSWSPRVIQLSHKRPAKPAPLKRFFGAPIAFDAQLSGVVFESPWLDHPIAGADPDAFAAIVQAIHADPPQSMSRFVAQVRRSLYLRQGIPAPAGAGNPGEQKGSENHRQLRRARPSGSGKPRRLHGSAQICP